MRFKILFIVGLGTGYILGARAGRPRYERIKARATEAWEDPRVQKVVTDAQDFVKETAPIVQEKVVAGTKAAVESTKGVTKATKEASRKIAKSAKKASKNVSRTAKEVRDRIIDRGEEAVDHVITSIEKTLDDAPPPTS